MCPRLAAFEPSGAEGKGVGSPGTAGMCGLGVEGRSHPGPGGLQCGLGKSVMMGR